MTVSWREFWNGETSVYCSRRHKAVHDSLVARDVAKLLPADAKTVLDHGCGEGQASVEILRKVEHLFLCDGAETARQSLLRRYAGEARATVLAPEEIEAGIADGTLDCVVANSLVQYLSREELAVLIDQWHRKLKPEGRLVIGDVVPTDQPAWRDALSLIRFGWQGGFLFAAVFGLGRMAFSNYRKLRAEIGLTTYSESDFLVLLDNAGFEPLRHRPNIGHNQDRMTFIATRRG
jgi:SAM-dependent methyltransferase